MNLRRLIGDAARHIPGVHVCVDHVRFTLRKRRLVDRYTMWVRAFDTPTAADITAIRTRAAALGKRPVISLIMPLHTPDSARLKRAIKSVRLQAYTAWELLVITAADRHGGVAEVLKRQAARDPRIILCDADATRSPVVARNAALAVTSGDFVAVVGEHDVLPPQALYWIAEAIERNPNARVIYADEDRIDARGLRSDPWFKCDYNRELLLTHDALARPTAYARHVACELGGWREELAGAEDYDLALRATATVGDPGIVHVPRILLHRGEARAGGAAALAAAGRRAVSELLRQQGSAALVQKVPEAPAYNRVRHPLPAELPLVSIIICTRDHERLLRCAVESIASRTTYPRYEVLIIDNGSVEPGAVAYLAELTKRPGIRVLRDDAAFNYSRLNNRAATAAQGALLCLLNNDIEVLTPDWLEEMVSFAVRPDVGAVGARLWYPDGTLQHGGVILGICHGAIHAHLRLGRGNPGYAGRAVLQQELTAVTAACLVVRAEVFAAAGGLDERFAVAFNDVDFCLRLRAAGYRNIWTPFAELVHHESASRGGNDTPAKRAREEHEIGLLRDRWGDTLRCDPFYNPNLSHTSAAFSIDVPTRKRRAA